VGQKALAPGPLQYYYIKSLHFVPIKLAGVEIVWSLRVLFLATEEEEQRQNVRTGVSSIGVLVKVQSTLRHVTNR